MPNAAEPTYPPLDTLKAVAPDLWIVDGPAIRFGMPWPKMPFPTRMTVIRLGSDLLIHSPTRLAPSLGAEIAAIGTPRWIVGPNRLHYWWIPEWRAMFPRAEIYLAPRTEEQARDHIDFPHRTLDRGNGYPWDGTVDTLPVSGSFMTEVVLFHSPSRTLVLTDFIENFEPDKVSAAPLRWLMRWAGVLAPDGQMPRDMRMTYARHKTALRSAVRQMIGWNPERVIVAHGRWFESNGAAELRRAFRWLL
jgi:hypothetical protein